MMEQKISATTATLLLLTLTLISPSTSACLHEMQQFLPRFGRIQVHNIVFALSTCKLYPTIMITKEIYFVSTPEKAIEDRKFISGHLYKMENSRFRGGTWMEHRLLGGVVIALYGIYFLDNTSEESAAIRITVKPGYFKVISKDPTPIIRRADASSGLVARFYKFTGYLYNINTKSFVDEATDVYYSCCIRYCGEQEVDSCLT